MFACNSFLFMIFQRSFGIRSFQHGSARSAVRRTSKHLESFKGRHRLRTRWTGSYFFSFPSWFFCIRRSLLRIVSIFSSNWLEKDFKDGFFSVAAMYISSFLSFVFSFLLLSLSFYRIYMYIIYYMNICTYICISYIYIYIYVTGLMFNWFQIIRKGGLSKHEDYFITIFFFFLIQFSFSSIQILSMKFNNFIF